MIIIDYREKNSLVPSEIVNLEEEINFKELKVGDYLVNGIIIERKTISDFLTSLTNRRLITQLESMQQYEKKLLIIEGLRNQELYNDSNKKGINSNAIRGFLLSIALKYKVPFILTNNEEDTAKFIVVLSKKKEKASPLNAKRKAHNPQEQKQFIIEGFPGIGASTSKKLLKKFSSIKNIINAPENELKKILGKKAKNIKKIIEDNY